METSTAISQLAALAQETRLQLFRRLVRRGAPGMAAGEIAEELGVAKPTLSFHLAQLEGAGLVTSRREGRSILYAVAFESAERLVAYLYENCCAEGACCLPATALRAPKAPSKRRDS